MALQVIVGYGPIGRGAAGLLAAQGHQVRVITRSGGPADRAAGPGGRISHVRLDAADADALTEAAPLNAQGPKGLVRATMWRDALAAHDAGRVRATEIRAADYIGLDSQSLLGGRVIPRLLAGRGVQVMRSADTLHSWSYVGDVARLLVTVG